jgi:peptidoglycan/xylan/chitin deacetylase (PgdA/CDA1 family)
MDDQVPVLEASRPGARIMIALLYHDIVTQGHFSSSGFSGGDADIYKFEVEEFDRHLDAIGSAAGKFSVSTINRHKINSGRNPVLLTFDDGGAGALLAADLLERRGWRGHFFVTTDCIGRPEFLSRAEIRGLHARGHVIGSHSCSHPARISHCSPTQLRREWSESTRILSDICGAPIRAASVPGGYFAAAVAEAAADAGITTLFNSEPKAQATTVRNCTVIGRYSIQQGVSAEKAASIAAGDWLPRMQQFLFWNTKKLAKTLAGNYYISARKTLLNRESKKAA